MRYDLYDEDDRPIPDFTLVRKGKVLHPLLGRQSYVQIDQTHWSRDKEVVLVVSDNGRQSTGVNLSKEMFLLLKEAVNDPAMDKWFGIEGEL